MRTLLVADKLGGAKPFHHEQLSRSFVLNMVHFLYMQTTQQNIPASGAIYDTAGGGRTVYLNQNNAANMIVRPMGHGNNDNINNGLADYHWEQLGIRLGSGLVAPTPTDYSILGTLIPNSWQAPEASPAIKMAYDWLKSNPSNYRDCYGANWVGQTFHVREPVSVTGCNMRFVAYGNPGGQTLTISLRRVLDDKTNVIATDLASGTYALPGGLPTAWPGQFLGVTFGTPYVVHPGYQYALIARISGNDTNNKLRAVLAYSSDYNKQDHAGLDVEIDSSNSGSTWNGGGEYSNATGYQLLGQTPVGLAYSGTKVFPVTVSGGSAQFILEALFSNYSSQSITASEVALMCFGNDNGNTARALTYMLAHDLLSSPITVNAGEILRMRYIPTINV